MKIVLLHPLPLNGSMWPEHIRALEPATIAPDLYGLGDSIEAWASGALALAGTGPLVVVGNSVGGSCAIEMAYQAPDRVRLIVLAGAKPGHRPEPDFRDEAVRYLSEEGMDGAWRRYWEPLFGPETDPSVVRRARAIACAQEIDAVINGVTVFHCRPDRSAFLETLDIPIVVVSGEHDRTPAEGTSLAASLRRGSFKAVEGAGHYVPMERPAEFAAIVRGALMPMADALAGAP